MNNQSKITKTASAPVNALRHHVTGAIERGEATAIVEQKAAQQPQHSPLPWELGHELGDGFSVVREIAPGCGKLSVIANVQYSNVKYQPARDEAKANANLIVASVNHADKLADMLAKALPLVESLVLDDSERNRTDATAHHTFNIQQAMRETLEQYQNAKGGE